MIKSKTVRTIPGYVEGMRLPSLSVHLQLQHDTEQRIAIKCLLRHIGPLLFSRHLEELQANARTDNPDAIQGVLTVVAGLLELSGIPVLETPLIGSSRENSKSMQESIAIHVHIPSYDKRATLLTLEWVLKFLNHPDSAQKHLTPAFQNELNQLIQQIRQFAPRGSNNIRFICAAHELGIPVLPLTEGIIQFGWGSNARLFNSSISDETPAIGVGLAKNKLASNAFLKLAGLPSPQDLPVRNPAEAVSAARQIGFPVVVKPVDLDQGIGVSADLRTPMEVHRAFEQAIKLSPHVMVEKHIRGTGFRITLVRGEPVAIVRRIPAGVTGDGVSTIHALVKKTNTDPRRSAVQFSIMKPIVIDDEAKFLLGREGMNQDSVPAAGQFVALKRAANVSTGGDSVVLDNNEIDASYIDLVNRAAQLLRLDIAAVDFITDDIRRPWQETGAAIIEVNAQPQMGTILTHLHGRILETYVQGNGTIPSILVFGVDPGDLVGMIRQRSNDSCPGLGTVSPEGVFVGKNRIIPPGQSLLAATRVLLVNPQVTALLLAAAPDSLIAEGMPLPFFHHLVIGDWPEKRALSAQILSLFEKHILGRIWIEKKHPLLAQVQDALGPEKIREFESRESLLTAIGKTLGNAEPDVNAKTS